MYFFPFLWIYLPQKKQDESNIEFSFLAIKELQVKYPFVQWLDYIKAILPKDVKVDENEIVFLNKQNYFDQLGNVLEETPMRWNNYYIDFRLESLTLILYRTIANYITWRIAEFSIKFLGDKFQQRELQFLAVLSGTQELEPRWKQCVDTTTSYFSISISAQYIRKHYNEYSRVVALEMINNIKDELKDTLMNVPWMDETTRNAALLKLENMKAHIGYPDELMDDKNIMDYYKLTQIDENDYLESALNLKFLEYDRQLRQLHLPVNKTDWRDHSSITEVNAYYYMNKNAMQFPASILQGQFFNVYGPKYLNYGAMGSVIGHELCHGFDGKSF